MQQRRPLRTQTGGTAALLGSLLLALTLSPSARATTYVTVDGHSNPVSLVEGETATFHYDVAKPGGTVSFIFARDLTGTGKFDVKAPVARAFSTVDGGSLDVDPAPGKIATAWVVSLNAGDAVAAGPYILHLADDGSTVDLPITVVPKPESQAISGRVAVVSATNPSGTPPPDAIIWAYSDSQTVVASAHIQADGSYSLPVPPGTYIVFAEWFGNLRSQRQLVSVAAGQAQSATRTLTDGTCVLVLPSGKHRITAAGMTQETTFTVSRLRIRLSSAPRSQQI